jgi:hypothetical protein
MKLILRLITFCCVAALFLTCKKDDKATPPDNILVSGWIAYVGDYPRAEASYEYNDQNRLSKLTFRDGRAETYFEATVSYNPSACIFEFMEPVRQDEPLRYQVEFIFDDSGQVTNYLGRIFSGMFSRDDQSKVMVLKDSVGRVLLETVYNEIGALRWTDFSIGYKLREVSIVYDMKQLNSPGVFNTMFFPDGYWPISFAHEPIPFDMAGISWVTPSKYLPKKVTFGWNTQYFFYDEWSYSYKRGSDGRLAEIRKTTKSTGEESRIVFSYINKK